MPAGLGRPLALVLGYGVLGALCGVLWERVWQPPSGLVVHDRWVLQPAGPDYSFAGTGWYVVIGAAAGLLTAVLIAALLRGRELATLAGICLGALLAGAVMYAVGHALGPADPQALAVGRPDFTELPGDLRLAGASAYAAFPGGALLGACLVFLLTRGRGDGRPPSAG